MRQGNVTYYCVYRPDRRDLVRRLFRALHKA